MVDPVPVQQSAKCVTCGLAEDALCPRCERRRLHFTRPTTCEHHGFEAAPVAPSQSVEEARTALEVHIDHARYCPLHYYTDEPAAAPACSCTAHPAMDALIEAVRREQRVVVILQAADMSAFARGEDTEHMAGTRVHADANVRYFLARHLMEGHVVVDGEQDGDHHQPSATVAE